jgi:hypothetical protein
MSTNPSPLNQQAEMPKSIEATHTTANRNDSKTLQQQVKTQTASRATRDQKLTPLTKFRMPRQGSVQQQQKPST